MKHWLLHAERLPEGLVTNLILRQSPSDQLKPRLGDRVVLVSRDKDMAAWVTHGSALIVEVASEGGIASGGLEVKLQFDEIRNESPDVARRNIRPIWMSLSSSDQVRIKECCSSRVGAIEPLSSNGAKVIANSTEFPIGNAIWLLRQHFSEVADQALLKIEFAASRKGLSRWYRALDVLETHLNDLVIVPAYLASFMGDEWARLAQRTKDQSLIDKHVFMGTRRGSNAGPSQIRQSISVSLAKEVVHGWNVVRDERGQVKSGVLEEVFASARSEQESARLAAVRFPEYPGSLFNEF